MLLLVLAADVVQQHSTTKQSTAVNNVSQANACTTGALAEDAVPGASGEMDCPERILARGAAANAATVWVRMNKGATELVI
mmetsp:Transcript_9917/g.23630  ORF Transcript_9917/g.23630 Transcript_9917/m.23630 type:complete len:81 (-) Transcript_9917:981-1223(-)